MATYQLGPVLYQSPSASQITTILRKGGFLLPDPPAFDASTHHAPVWDPIPQTNNPSNWIVTALTAQELALKTKQAEGDAQKANLISVYNAMFNGTGTTGERATRLEKSLCWVVRHYINLVD